MFKNLWKILLFCSVLSLMSSCQLGSGKSDEPNLVARYIKNIKSLWSNKEDKPLVREQKDFLGPEEEEFIPLQEDDLYTALVDYTVAQPRETPGEVGSLIPGIERFMMPAGQESSIFKTLYFNTNDHVLRSKEYIQMAQRMGHYLKEHKNMYLFISGHCDERGPEAYNLALGTRRANHVRTLLVQNGVNPEQIYTISYGKEKPFAIGHSPLDWSKNRRTEFKIYKK